MNDGAKVGARGGDGWAEPRKDLEGWSGEIFWDGQKVIAPYKGSLPVKVFLM